MPKTKHCENPDFIRSTGGGRVEELYAGDLAWFEADPECSWGWCNSTDIREWADGLNLYARPRLEAAIIRFESVKHGKLDANAQAIYDNASSLLSMIDVEYQKWKKEADKWWTGESFLGDYRAAPIVEEIIARFRQVACAIDDMNKLADLVDAPEGPSLPDVHWPGEGEERPKRKIKMLPYVLIGGAAFFAYKAITE